jgi:hypothetical protein
MVFIGASPYSLAPKEHLRRGVILGALGNGTFPGRIKVNSCLRRERDSEPRSSREDSALVIIIAPRRDENGFSVGEF